MGGNHSVFSATKFVPNDAVPGQAQSVLEVASVLNISKRDLNKIYAAYVRFHTDGVTFKIVTNYVLLTMGVEATPWNHAIFKLWDEKVEADFMNFEEFVEFIWSFLALDDIMIQMLPFVLLDMDQKGTITGDDMHYLMLCLHGMQAERDKDLRLPFQRIRELGDVPVTREMYINLVHSFPIILLPMIDMRVGLTKRIGGLKTWIKYRDWRSNKIYERLERSLVELTDYYIDDTCLIRFFSLCNVEMPVSTQVKFDTLRAKRDSLFNVEDSAEILAAAKKRKRKQMRDDQHKENVMQIMAPIAHRLTFNVDNIGGNKFARALAYGLLSSQGKKNVAQLQQQHPRGHHHHHGNNAKAHTGATAGATAGDGAGKHKKHHGDGHEQYCDNPSDEVPEPGPIVTNSVPARPAAKFVEDHRHHRHHHHSSKSSDQDGGKHEDSNAGAVNTVEKHINDHELGQPQHQQRTAKPRPPNDSPNANSRKGMAARLSNALGLSAFSSKVKLKKQSASPAAASDSAEDGKVLAAAKTQHNRFGNVKVKIAPEIASTLPGPVPRQVQAATPQDDLEIDLQRRKVLMSSTGDGGFSDMQDEGFINRDQYSSDSPKPAGRKSIVERISFAFHQVKTKSGQKQQKYKLKYGG